MKPTHLYIAYLHILYLVSNQLITWCCVIYAIMKLSDNLNCAETNCANQQSRAVCSSALLVCTFRKPCKKCKRKHTLIRQPLDLIRNKIVKEKNLGIFSQNLTNTKAYPWHFTTCTSNPYFCQCSFHELEREACSQTAWCKRISIQYLSVY